jgi:hypothetical protein
MPASPTSTKTRASPFSEYPFFVDLLPESIFSQKVELLCRQVLGVAPNIKGRSRFYKLFERVSPAKLERSLRSPYDTRVRAVFSFLAVTQVLFILLLAIGVISLFAIPLERVAVWSAESWARIFSFGFGLFLLYIARFNLLVGGFFRDRLRYESRLYASGIRRLSIAFTLRIFRTFLFRYTLAAWAWLYLLGGLLYVGLAILLWALR